MKYIRYICKREFCKVESLQSIKQRFSIVGNHPAFNRALEKAMQIASADISVLVIGESGVGKEFIPKIIHYLSARKHHPYLAVNCGAIPEGTIDSELFGHEKGAFTGADKTRKGYFEMANNGTIFLDEIGELPLPSQARLLRVLETGEFIKVGSSQVEKTNVRVIAATNVNLLEAIEKKKFREDLYYRLNTVQIEMPSLRERKEDIYLLFRKFSADFADQHRMPHLELTPDAIQVLTNYPFPGNIRQLKNIAQQVTLLEKNRKVDASALMQYLPPVQNSIMLHPAAQVERNDFSNERELLYKVLFDLKKDLNDLKNLTKEILKHQNIESFSPENQEIVAKLRSDVVSPIAVPSGAIEYKSTPTIEDKLIEVSDYEEVQPSENSLSLQEKEIELIKKALEKHKGRRRNAAEELGISERTLYRKIKQYQLD